VRKFEFRLVVKHLANGDQYFVHETAICSNLPIHHGIEDSKKLDRSLTEQ